MNLLEDRHLAPFRKEYLEREKEIQRYIGVYLSGVVIVFSWMIGPQSKPLYEMALGNDGYNIYAFLIVSVVNALFITFLIYKSLDVHDTTQFITVYAQPNSVYTFWENWRRDKHSATRPVRTVYFIALALLPTVMAFMLLMFSGSILFAPAQALKDQLVEIEKARQKGTVSANESLSPSQGQPPLPTPTLSANPSPLPTSTTIDENAPLDRIQSVFSLARIFFGLVIGLHFVPIWFFYHNTVPTKRRWEALVELKEAQENGVSPRSKLALELESLVAPGVVTVIDTSARENAEAPKPGDGKSSTRPF